MKFHRFIYNHSILISILFFIVITLLASNLFGYTGCADGWSSGSIGKRGACSHHGGVTSNLGLILIITTFLSVAFYNFLSKKYKEVRGYVVLSNLPKHNLESELEDYIEQYQKHKKVKEPEKEAKSRKDYRCKCCNKKFKKGTVYFYFTDYESRYSDRVKHCYDCTLKIFKWNNYAEEKSNEIISKIERLKKVVNAYYSKHSID